jgi:hypothetical protein
MLLVSMGVAGLRIRVVLLGVRVTNRGSAHG